MLIVYKITNCSPGMLLLDEPDAGTSGNAAVSISQYIANVTKKLQIFVITHQLQAMPQSNLQFNATKQHYVDYSEIVITALNRSIKQAVLSKELTPTVVFFGPSNNNINLQPYFNAFKKD